MDLEKLRELFQLLLEHLPLGVIVTDTEGDIVFVNQSAEKIRNAKRQNLSSPILTGKSGSCH